MVKGIRNEGEHRSRQMRGGGAGQCVLAAQIYGLDEEKLDDPRTVDFNRPISAHLVFGGGLHRCLGSHLARLEIRVFLEEWTRMIPRFSVGVEGETKVDCGAVWVPHSLPLRWAVVS